MAGRNNDAEATASAGEAARERARRFEGCCYACQDCTHTHTWEVHCRRGARRNGVRFFLLRRLRPRVLPSSFHPAAAGFFLLPHYVFSSSSPPAAVSSFFLPRAPPPPTAVHSSPRRTHGMLLYSVLRTNREPGACVHVRKLACWKMKYSMLGRSLPQPHSPSITH